MKQSTSTDMKKGRKRCLDRVPYHLCHPGWRAEGELPPSWSQSTREAHRTGQSWTGLITKKLPWSWWDTTTPGLCSVPGQVAFTARTPGEAEEHSPGKTQGGLAPVFHRCRDLPNHPLQPGLCTRLYRSLFGSAHMLAAVRGWILPVLASVLEKK